MPNTYVLAISFQETYFINFYSGSVICGAKPIRDPYNKWYSPKYMYEGKVYPMYLSGTGKRYLRPKCTRSKKYSMVGI